MLQTLGPAPPAVIPLGRGQRHVPDGCQEGLQRPPGSRPRGKGPAQLAPRRAADPTAWITSYRRCARDTERDAKIVDFYLYLAATLVTIRQLIQQARSRYRWHTRPATKRLR
jgi:hypothetical protein